MKKKNKKLNKKQNLNRQGLVKTNEQFNYPLLWNIAKKQQIANLKSVEKMEKKYDKKFKEVFSLLEQLIAKKK